MKKIFFIAVVSLAVGVSGCTSWTQLTGREYQEKGKGFKAEMPQDWMRYNMGPHFMMTKDGTTLDIIFIERAKFDKKLEHTKKKYLQGMTIQELAEIEIDNIRSNGDIDKFQLISNQPVTLDGQSAFKMEYTYVFLLERLKIHAIHYGFIKDEWIYRIRFEAAEQHYFKKTRPDFERFINSFKLI